MVPREWWNPESRRGAGPLHSMNVTRVQHIARYACIGLVGHSHEHLVAIAVAWSSFVRSIVSGRGLNSSLAVYLFVASVLALRCTVVLEACFTYKDIFHCTTILYSAATELYDCSILASAFIIRCCCCSFGSSGRLVLGISSFSSAPVGPLQAGGVVTTRGVPSQRLHETLGRSPRSGRGLRRRPAKRGTRHVLRRGPFALGLKRMDYARLQLRIAVALCPVSPVHI